MNAWIVSFGFGPVSSTPKVGSFNVRCVRGGSGASPSQTRFARATFSGDGLVTDGLTGLMWQYSAVSSQSWQQGLAYCESLTYAGFDDWRLPKKKTLMSLMDYGHNNPISDFPQMPRERFWTSAPYLGNQASWSWYVSFDGAAGGMNRNSRGGSYYVRCVR